LRLSVNPTLSNSAILSVSGKSDRFFSKQNLAQNTVSGYHGYVDQVSPTITKETRNGRQGQERQGKGTETEEQQTGAVEVHSKEVRLAGM
jgi:hypothetical protein